ncbi:MAG: hypothetical protein PGN19_12880 [Pseudomonas oryzihabitans]
MGIEEEDGVGRLKGAGQLDARTVMDRARSDRAFMNRIIQVLEECGVDDRTDEENTLLEWARAFQRRQGVDDE